ncbi:transmembrane protein, putative [Medicago truncatula]|uniref:Transmembrane protein, putative n=1 Tax=Medicago truncatula TaxID=3880 RepID=G7IAJ4_MEDTR|nr:transmembrane protein, putative [Medicago truncatula]
MVCPIIVGVMVDVLDQVIIISFSPFVLSLFIFLINDSLQKDIFSCTHIVFVT